MRSVAALVATTLALGACGDGRTLAERARAAAQRSLGITLREQPASVREVEAAFAGSDHGHFVELYVLRSTADAAAMRAAVPPAPAGAAVHVLVRGRLFATYSATGSGDRARALDRALAQVAGQS